MTDKSTEQRVLECACRTFAEKGFHNSTVADICSAAKANIASVNYYFRSKEGLYKEVWRHASELSEEKYPDKTDAESDTMQRLRVFIANKVRSIFDSGPAGWFPRIINREMANPSPMEKELFREFLVPRRNALEEIIRELLGPDATDKQVATCTINVISIYAFMNIARIPRQHIFGSDNPTEEQLSQLILQMQDFVCAAVEGTKTSIQKNK